MLNVLEGPGFLLQSLKLIWSDLLASFSVISAWAWLVARRRQSVPPPLSWGGEIVSTTTDGNDENWIKPTTIAVLRTLLNLYLARVIKAAQKREPNLHQLPR